MKKMLTAVTLLALLLSLSVPAFSQAGFFATVTGTVSDSSGALIPGVSVRATATETGVVSTLSRMKPALTTSTICFRESTRSVHHYPGSKPRTLRM